MMAILSLLKVEVEEEKQPEEKKKEKKEVKKTRSLGRRSTRTKKYISYRYYLALCLFVCLFGAPVFVVAFVNP